MTELWEALTSDFPRTALTLMGALGWLAILYSLLRWFVKTARDLRASFRRVSAPEDEPEAPPETPHERIGRIFAETVRALRDHPPRATGAEEDSSIGAPDPGMRILVSTEEPDSDNIEGLDVHVHLTGNTASLYRANTEDEGDETVWYPPEPVSGGQTTILAAEGFLLFLWAANIGEASLTDLARRRMEAKEGRLVLEGLPKNIQGALRRMPETARAETMRVFNIVQDGFPRAHAALRPTPRGRIIDLDD